MERDTEIVGAANDGADDASEDVNSFALTEGTTEPAESHDVNAIGNENSFAATDAQPRLQQTIGDGTDVAVGRIEKGASEEEFPEDSVEKGARINETVEAYNSTDGLRREQWENLGPEARLRAWGTIT